MNSRSDINELCEENKTCEIWRKHREAGKKVDSFKSYQKLDDDIAFIKKNGVDEFDLNLFIIRDNINDAFSFYPTT